MFKSQGTKLLLVGQLVQGHEGYLRDLQRWVLDHDLTQVSVTLEGSEGKDYQRCWVQDVSMEGINTCLISVALSTLIVSFLISSPHCCLLQSVDIVASAPVEVVLGFLHAAQVQVIQSVRRDA